MLLRKETQPRPLNISTITLGMRRRSCYKHDETLHPTAAPELASSNGAAERKECRASLGVLQLLWPAHAMPFIVDALQFHRRALEALRDVVLMIYL
jgi:hypothetical protein